MANPRIFISSTCYDLQEVRYQLRGFINDFGLEPVMSDFGDIFYDYKKHIQDSCKDEIGKCQLFILIIGNNYGSFYFKNQENQEIPDSVTLQEFKRAIDVNIFKHIFVNKYVDYDFKNYQKALKSFISKTLEKNSFPEDKIDETISQLKREFLKSYHFPQDSYKYIFRFLEIVYSLKSNNAILTFENFDDIKTNLRKQWAGFMYDSLTKETSVAVSELSILNTKVDKIDKQIRSLIEGKEGNQNDKAKVTFDVTQLAKELSVEDFIELKENLHRNLYEILYVSEDYSRRITFRKQVNDDGIRKWLKELEEKVKKYKWSQSMNIAMIFDDFSFIYWKNRSEVPYSNLLNFYNVVKQIEKHFKKEDYDAVITTISEKINKLYEPEEGETGDLSF